MNESRMVLWKELYNEEQEQIAQADSIIHQNDELLKQLCENQERAKDHYEHLASSYEEKGQMEQMNFFDGKVQGLNDAICILATVWHS